MQIDFLYWSGCPSHETALGELREAMSDLAIEPTALRAREIKTREEAVAASFPGSPTIRVDGADIESTDEGPQLTCRVYRRRDGRISPTPDPTAVRDALAAARANETRRNR
jgi:hypothetical protein